MVSTQLPGSGGAPVPTNGDRRAALQVWGAAHQNPTSRQQHSMDQRHGRPLPALAPPLVLSTVLTLAASGLAVATAAPAQFATTIMIDGGATGQVFDGDGAISGGGNSQLLFDYPEPHCSQILDCPFVPGHGAAVA